MHPIRIEKEADNKTPVFYCQPYYQAYCHDTNNCIAAF